MDFPAYVPEGARSHALHYLGHWEPALSKREAELKEIEERITYWRHPNQDSYYAENQLAELRQRKAEATKRRDSMACDVESIKRLIHDARMKEVYRILTNAFFDDEEQEKQRKINGFIYAAWSANLDFSPYRECLKQAAELRDEITKTANKLADLLNKMSSIGVYCPAEFYSIPELLRNTDNHELNNHNLYMWQGMRRVVLGDPPRNDSLEKEQAESEPIEIVIKYVAVGEKVDIDPAEQARNNLRYAWEKAPPLSALLKTVSETAKEFKPSERGFIGAAIESRQQSVKTEYLRAFGVLLIDVHRFILNKDIMQAMAITANVVINSPDIDVTYDDARKSLAKLGGDSLENSK